MFFFVVLLHFVLFIFQFIGFPRTAGDSCKIRRKNHTHQNISHSSHDNHLYYSISFSVTAAAGATSRQILSITNTNLTQISDSIKVCLCFSFFTHQKQKLSRNCTILTEVRSWQRRSSGCQNDCGAATLLLTNWKKKSTFAAFKLIRKANFAE